MLCSGFQSRKVLAMDRIRPDLQVMIGPLWDYLDRLQGGVAATTKKSREASFERADGAVAQKILNGIYRKSLTR